MRVHGPGFTHAKHARAARWRGREGALFALLVGYL